MNVLRSESKIEALQNASHRLEEVLKESEKKPILLMVSGGSSLELLEKTDESVLGPQVCITVLDERFSFDPEVNNWLQIKATEFYSRAEKAGCEFIDTVPKTQESIDQFTRRWNKDLKKWIKKNPHRTIIATVGIGSDGHVAGISPFPEDPERFLEFYMTSDWVKGYSGNLDPSERVTVTAKFMEDKMDHAIVYAVGEGKREALGAVLSEEGRMADTPARILREMAAVEIYTDNL